MSVRHLLKQHNNLLKNQTENLSNRLVRQFHTNLEELLENSPMDPDIKDDFFSLINLAIKNTNLETDDLYTGRDKDLSHPLPDRYQERTSLSWTPLKTLTKQGKPKKDKEKGKPKKKKSKDKNPYSYLIESSESDAENDMDKDGDIDRDRDRDGDIDRDRDGDIDRDRDKNMDVENDTDNDRNMVDESQNLARVTLKTKDLIIVTLNPDNTVKELPNVSDQSDQSDVKPIYYYHKYSECIFDVQRCAIGKVNNGLLERFKD